MRFKRVANRRRASATTAAEIAPADASPAERMASAALESEGVTAATVAGEHNGEASHATGAAEAAGEEREEPMVVDAEEASVDREEVEDEEDRVEAAVVDSNVVEDARVCETGMEDEEADEENPVEVEVVVDETRDQEQGVNAADVNEADLYPDEIEDGNGDVNHLSNESDASGSEIGDAANAEVQSTLKELGIDEIEMSLPYDPDSGGRNRRFAFVQFASHPDAIEAFQRLRKPDAIFGMNRSAKVSFAQTPLRPSEDLLMKVQTVYLEHIPLSWDEETIEECCKEHGEIKKVAVFRKLKRSKKKDISFVEFCSRNSALACVEGINNGKIGDGGVKVFASLARPVCKGRLAKQGTRGGYKVDGGTTVECSGQPEQNKAQADEVTVKKNAPRKFPKGNNRKHESQASTGVHKASQHYKGKRQARGSTHTFVNERQVKKARTKCDVPKRSSVRGYVSGFESPRGAHAGQLLKAHVMHSTGPNCASIYQDFSYACASGSNAQNGDLEPHAGYIPATNHARTNYAYDQWRTAPYDNHRTTVPIYDRGPLRPANAAHANYTVFQSVYAYAPPSGPYLGDGLQNHPRS